MSFPEELRTARLLLARLRPNDHDELYRMASDPRVAATLGGVLSDVEAAERTRRHLAHWDEHGFGWWVARDPAGGQFVGRGGLRYYTLDGRIEVEVGYGLLPEFWGRGLAAELAGASVWAGFRVLGRPDLITFTLPTNSRSRRVMEKVGFRYERDIVHADLPHVLYRLTATAWRALPDDHIACAADGTPGPK
jgi:RimJ/RimL family protein N-acetyltransferase